MKNNASFKSKAMRAALLCFFILSIQKVSAQSFYGENLYVLNWGYGRTNATFQFPGALSYRVNVGHAPLTYEYFKRNVYFYSDVLTPLIDLCLGAFDSQYWWGYKRDGFVFNGGDWPLARLAFGGYFGDRVGLYAGGQWGYSHWKIEPGQGYYGQYLHGNVTKTEVGGHTFGPGVHVVLDFDKLLVRNSFMYDFVTQGFKGSRYAETFTWDIMAMYGLTYDNMLGVFVNYVLSPQRHDVKISKFRIGLSLAFNK